MNNLINKRYGKLTVLERDNTPRKDKHIYWICKCDCGNIISIRSTLLTTGKKTSCGCENNYYKGKIIDLRNQIFGNLLVLYPTEKRSGSNVMWHCKCKCGNESDISSYSLRKGFTKSCGCLKISNGEQKIIELLNNNNIPYETQKTFETCRSITTNALLRFDFYVDNNYLIEYDGVQHFKCEYKNNSWNNPNNLKKVKLYDNLKNNWCIKNNISLIRIPYTHYNNLCIKDLLLETSHFIIN